MAVRRLFATILLAGSLAVAAVLPASAASLTDICPEPGVPCTDYDELARIIDSEILPLPDGNPGPIRMPPGGWSEWGRAQPRTPVWNPPGSKRVGLQAGHYRHEQAPGELIGLRSNPGAPGGGRIEWEVTIDVAERAADILRARGIEVDILPTTIPIRYRAHAFVAVHVDGDESGRLSGYKVSRPNFSSVPEVDEAFVDIAHAEYGAATGMIDDSAHISGRMRNYYAFNARRYQHAVAPGVPQIIVETGFMSSARDRAMLFGQPELPALGLANAVSRFLAADLR